MQVTNLKNAKVTVLLEMDGQMHLIAMKQDHLELISAMTKAMAAIAIPTGKTQTELNSFLGYGK